MIANNSYIKIFGTMGLSIGLMVILFLSSEQEVHRNNAFIRRYPPHPITKLYDLDVGHNSYYIAGFDRDLLYLGNRSAPWHLLQVNMRTKDTLPIRLTPSSNGLRYRSIHTSVFPPYFFVMDGTMPFILRGRLGEWKAHAWMEGAAFFDRAVPVDSHLMFIRTISSKTQKSTLGIIKKTTGFQVALDTTLLEAQIDGIFDVDGTMVLSKETATMGYVYYYRNQFMTMNLEMKGLHRHRTIDTVETAQISLAEPNLKGDVSMKSPPLFINKATCMSRNLLLIVSDRLGKNESEEMLDEATIVDAYDYLKGSYEYSFYIYDIKKHKVREFAVHEGYLVALLDTQISVYETLEPYFDGPISKISTNNQSIKDYLLASSGRRSKTRTTE